MTVSDPAAFIRSHTRLQPVPHAPEISLWLADEITPDTCRLWDLKDHSGKIEHLDKDLFRRDLGNIIPAYEEIYSRLKQLADSEGVKDAE